MASCFATGNIINALHIWQGTGNSIEKEYGVGLDSELTPDYMMPESEVSAGSITACGESINVFLVGPQSQLTSGPAARTHSVDGDKTPQSQIYIHRRYRKDFKWCVSF